MVQRIGGFRRKTRYKLKRDKRQRGKLNLRRYLEEYKPGEKVLLKPDSIVQKGMFNPRFIGRVGVISKKQGACYEVIIFDGKKEKKLISHPIHMTRC
jgi:large subunit ribosomal protein L21e